MTCIGCGHLLIDGQTARCALRINPPRSMTEFLAACSSHTENKAHDVEDSRAPLQADQLPPSAREIVVAVANAFALTPADVMATTRQGCLNQHVRHSASPDAVRRMTLAFARQAVIVLLLRGGFRESQVKEFLGRSANTRFHAAKAAEPIMRSDRRLAGLFTRLIDRTGA